jgi:hypothetical protein
MTNLGCNGHAFSKFPDSHIAINEFCAIYFPVSGNEWNVSCHSKSADGDRDCTKEHEHFQPVYDLRFSQRWLWKVLSLEYNVVQSVEPYPTFRRNMSPPTSDSKNELSKNIGWSRQQEELCFSALQGVISQKIILFICHPVLITLQ